MSDSQDRVIALLDQLQTLMLYASDEHFSDIGAVLDDFSSVVSAELSDDDARISVRSSSKTPNVCGRCLKSFSREFACDNCGHRFRWCCAGYPREPKVNPRASADNADLAISLQRFCATCLAKRGLSHDAVLSQEVHLKRLEIYFENPLCSWRWVPCFWDGYSIYSAIWVGLEGLLFLLSPFYCGLSTEQDYVDSRNDPEFLLFVSNCATCALEIIDRTPELENERSLWERSVKHPEQPPNLNPAQFDLAWKAVCRFLNSEVPTCIKVWKYSEQTGLLEIDSTYEGGAIRIINVLKWNSDVESHFDLLLTSQIAEQDLFD